jgi:hypothetical protein
MAELVPRLLYFFRATLLSLPTAQRSALSFHCFDRLRGDTFWGFSAPDSYQTSILWWRHQ